MKQEEISNVQEVQDNYYEKYEKIAVFIFPHIRRSLEVTYKKYIKERPPSMLIYKDIIKKVNPAASKDVTLESIIAACTYIALSKETLNSAIQTYREYRRVYKRNWFQLVKEEIEFLEDPSCKMSPRNPQYLRTLAESTYQVNAFNRQNTDTYTVEDLMTDSYYEVKAWKEDLAALITDFKYLAMRPEKSMVNGFIYDVTYESLKIIRDTFSGSIEGYLLKEPTSFTDYPIFDLHKGDLFFEPEFIGNEILFLNHYQYDDKDITVQYHPDTKIPASIKSKDNLAEVMKKYDIDLNKQELDMVDRELVTHLFNYINGDTLNNSLINGDFRELVQITLGVKVPKKNHYDNITARLQKLRGYTYNIVVKDKDTGDVIESASIGLIDSVHIFPKENTFQFKPSEQWIQTYVEKKYTNILANSYKTVDSPQTKGIMMLLQKVRLTEYTNDSSCITLPLTYFRNHLKLINMPNSRLIKELSLHINRLKEKKIVIDDFEFINKNSFLHIAFTPLTSIEILAYGFPTKDHIIDVDYKLTDSEKEVIEMKSPTA